MKMDDRELDARLKFIEEKVIGIENILQQYWKDFTEKNDISSPEETGNIQVPLKSGDEVMTNKSPDKKKRRLKVVEKENG